MRNGNSITAAMTVVFIAAIVTATVVGGFQEKEPPESTDKIPDEPPPTATTESIQIVQYAMPVIELAAVEETKPEPILQQVSAPAQQEPPDLKCSERELEMLAQTVWGEARGCPSDRWPLVIWTVFQRADSDLPDFRNQKTVEAVLKKPLQFTGYNAQHPIDPEMYAVVVEEARKWSAGEEPPTHEIYAPTLPYFFFDGDGRENWFRAEWR